MSLPIIIDSDQSLKEIYPILKSSRELALDTEFIWERTYYPILGIIQVGLAEGDSTIIDVNSIDDLSPLADIISDPNIQKVLHDSTQDLTIIHNACGAFPKNVFDTQKASGFTGLGSSVSLANLLLKTVKINLAKTETRTNWLKRPLSPKQIEYALDDVRYLCKAKKTLLDKIKNNDIQEWLMEEMKSLDNPDLYIEKDVSLAYLRIKGRKRLKHNELSLLQALAQWREIKAREDNLPREHVIADKQLIALCKINSASKKALMGNKKIVDQKLTSNLNKIIEIMTSDYLSNTNVKTEKLPGRRTGEKISALTDLVISIVKSKSLQYNIDPSLVYSRSSIESLIKDPNNHPFTGWRASFIGNDIAELIKGNRTVSINKKTGLPNI